MIRINLLPHREMRRAQQRREFFILAGMVAALGVVIVISVHGVIGGKIENQNRRNQYLEKQIVELDKQIAEIKKLKEQTQQLLARKNVVETLQSNRAETVHLLDQIIRQLPDGIYLKSIKQTGARVNIVGYTQSNARVSTLMRALEDSLWLESPTLIEIKAAPQGSIRLSEFSLNVTITRPTQEPAGGRKAGSAKDKAA